MIKERAKPFSTGEIGLFARKVRCKHCGYIMRSGKGRGKHYLKCGTRHVAKDTCIGSFIFVEKLERIVIEELQAMNEEYLDEERLEDEIVLKYSLEEEIAKWKSKSVQQEKNLANLDTAMKNLYLDKVKGEIDVEQFKVLCRELEADKEKARQQRKLFEERVEELQIQMTKQSDKKKIIQEYVHVNKLNRAMVEQLIDYIEVSKRDPETKMLNVEIHWNF